MMSNQISCRFKKSISGISTLLGNSDDIVLDSCVRSSVVGIASLIYCNTTGLHLTTEARPITLSFSTARHPCHGRDMYQSHIPFSTLQHNSVAVRILKCQSPTIPVRIKTLYTLESCIGHPSYSIFPNGLLGNVEHEQIVFSGCPTSIMSSTQRKFEVVG